MKTPPNVLFLISHDLGRFLPSYGVTTVQAPAITQLSREGVQLEESYCCAPQCSPSRAALFTGRYPHCNGVMGLTHASFAWDLHRHERHLASYLREAGYWTAGCGSLHECRDLQDRGWDHLIPNGGGLAKGRAQSAIGYLGQHWNRQQPFFLQVAFNEPHRPWRQPETSLGVTVPPFLKNTPAAQAEFGHFQGLIHDLDQGVAELLAWLRAENLVDNTLVIFTADHGMPFPRAKCSLYDPGLEVPLIMRWPAGGLTGGQRHHGLVNNVDCLPTLLELLDLPVPGALHGRSFVPLLRGEPYIPTDAIYGEMTYHGHYDPMRCIRTRTHKLIAFFSSAKSYMDPSQLYHPPCEPVAPANPANTFHEHLELYDLQHDPHERVNLAKDPAQAELLHRLSQRLLDWMTATDDPLLHGAITPPMHHATFDRLRQAAATRPTAG